MSEKKMCLSKFIFRKNVIDQITDKYDLPDKSKALRCLLDYVEEKD